MTPATVSRRALLDAGSSTPWRKMPGSRMNLPPIAIGGFAAFAGFVLARR